MKHVLLGVMALTVIISLSSCRTTVVTGTGYAGWFDVYGNQCGGLREGCTFVDPYGYNKAQWQQDPFYDPWQTPTYAWVYAPEFGYYTYAYGYWGINNVFYDYYTWRAVNNGNDQPSKDILTVVGNREEEVIQKVGALYAAKYGLDVDVGVRVARAANDYNKIGKTRERTEADLAEMTKRVYGVNLNDVKSALDKGDRAQVDSLIGTAAENWKTSPENMRTILNKVYHTSF
jgi:hypothetical protein